MHSLLTPLPAPLPQPSAIPTESPVRSEKHLTMPKEDTENYSERDSDDGSDGSTPKASPKGGQSPITSPERAGQSPNTTPKAKAATLASVPPQGGDIGNDTVDNTEHKEGCECHECHIRVHMNIYHSAIDIFEDEDLAAGDESVLWDAASACSRSCKICAEHIDACGKCKEVDLKHFFKNQGK